MVHEIFNTKYAANYSISDIEKIFNNNYKKVNFNLDLVKIYKLIFEDLENITIKSYKEYDKIIKLLLGKNNIPTNTRKTEVYHYYYYMYNNNIIKRNYNLEKFIKTKGCRSRSGIVQLTVFTAGDLYNADGTKNNIIQGGGCPMDCHFCPNEKNEKGIATQPRSYLSDEPGNMRATKNKHHPVGQTYDRLNSLQKIGHISNCPNDPSKIEFMISGATFSFYPKKYIIWFVRCIYYACNTFYEWEQFRPVLSMEEEQKINETSSIRVIGLTIETRPDYITPNLKGYNGINFTELEFLRYLGVTRVQIGIQTTKNNILKKINRKCTSEMNKLGIRRLKEAGIKVDIHIMFDLPGSSEEIDLEVMKEIINDPDYQADQWKLYPTEVTKFTKIKEWYDAGLYKPYAEDHSRGISYKLVNVIIYSLQHAPEYIRINRVVRDIPHKSIEGGVKMSNLRQIVKNIMTTKNIFCRDIRERESKEKTLDVNNLALNVLKYPASNGTEYFISFTTKNKKTLFGFIRLRLNNDMTEVMDCLKNHAFIRELHVYGQHTSIGSDIQYTSVQHKGLGAKLINRAEQLAYLYGFNKICVPPGCGVRGYYKKYGYVLGKHNYMYKKLNIMILISNHFIYYVYIVILFIIINIYIKK
tara:strand:+ start:343 stop:2262 length:1920 start_codon:yes stop_codon:yes gene_type:complete